MYVLKAKLSLPIANVATRKSAWRNPKKFKGNDVKKHLMQKLE